MLGRSSRFAGGSTQVRKASPPRDFDADADFRNTRDYFAIRLRNSASRRITFNNLWADALCAPPPTPSPSRIYRMRDYLIGDASGKDAMLTAKFYQHLHASTTAI